MDAELGTSDGRLREGTGGGESRPPAFEPVAMVAACPFPCRRGTPIRIERLAEAIARTGREVHVVAYHYGGNAARPAPGDGQREARYHLHRIRRVPGRWDPAPGPGIGKMAVLNPLLVGKTLSVIREHGIRVLHCHHYEGLLVGLAVRLFHPVSIVYDAHTLLGDELGYYSPQAVRSAVTRFGAALDRALPRLADHVIPVTEDIHDRLAMLGVESRRMTIVGNGIEEEAVELYRPGQIAPVPGRVVYAGNLAAYQGIDLLLEAFARVVAHRDDARLTFVSPGPHERVSQLATAAGVGGRVRIVDADSADMASELQAASVLVNPRVHCPGYPLKLLNYMAAGRPIVSFRSSGKNLRHGIDALLVPDGDVTGFADAIGALLADPAQCDRLGEAARKQVFAHYSWAAITGRVSKAYDQALLAPGGGAEHVAL